MSQSATSHRLYAKKKREFTKALKADNFSQVEKNKYRCLHCQYEFNYRIESAVRHLETCEHFSGKKTDAFLFLIEHYLNSSCPPSTVANQHVFEVFETGSTKSKRMTPMEVQAYKLDFVNLVVSGNVPFELVNNFYLKRLICHGDKQRIEHYPSKREVRHNLLDERLSEVESVIEDSFKEKYTAAVSLVCDSWTSISRSHLMGVILSRRGLKAIDYPVNIPITFSNDTAVNNAKFLEKIILKFNQRFGVTINNLVTDDASQLRKARGILGKRHPCILMCHCLAHQINLVVGKVLKKCGYPTLERAKALVAAYHNSTSHSKTLTECCINKYGPGKGIALKKMTKIRWNSAYFMLASILRIRGALLTLSQVLSSGNKINVPKALLIDDSFISECLRLVKILRPLTFVSLKMQRESENMSDLVGCFLELHDSLLGIPDEASKKDLLDDLDKRWIDYEHPVLILAFCLDPVSSVVYRKMHGSLRQDYGLTHVLLGYSARKYIKKYLGGVVEVRSSIVVELGRWLGEVGNGLVDAFKKEQNILSSKMNSWDFWEFASFDFPNLSLLGKFLATSKVSSATCERLFSVYARIKTKGRSKLKDDALSDIGVLKPYLKREVQELTGKLPREKNRKLLDYQEHSPLFAIMNPDVEVNHTENEVGGSESEVSDNENEEIVEGDVEEDWDELFSCGERLSGDEAISQVEVSADVYDCSFEESGTLAPEVFTGESYRCSAGEISPGSEVDDLEPWRSYKIPLEHLSRIWKSSISSNSAQLAQQVSDDGSSGESSTAGTKRKHNSN